MTGSASVPGRNRPTPASAGSYPRIGIRTCVRASVKRDYARFSHQRRHLPVLHLRSRVSAAFHPGGVRTDTQQTEIAGAAAKVANQDEFVVIQPAFVEVRRGDRFVFENDRPDTGFLERPLQPVERKLIVIFTLGIRITDGSPDDDGTIKRSGL